MKVRTKYVVILHTQHELLLEQLLDISCLSVAIVHSVPQEVAEVANQQQL